VPITNAQEKFVYALSLLYDAEHQFLAAQQQLLEQGSDEEFKGLLRTHIDQTQQQVENLQQVYRQIGEQPQRQTSEAVQGLVSDAQKSLQEAQEEPLRDTLIADAQAKVEHFEITCYRALIVGAQQMGQEQAVNLLQQNLQQEEQTAQMVEQSTPKLVQKAMQAAS
jgi:ferritin-like metal-binding protein YciE